MDKIDGKLILPTPKSIMDRTGPDRTGPDRTGPNQTDPLGDWGVGGCESRRGIQSQLKKEERERGALLEPQRCGFELHY